MATRTSPQMLMFDTQSLSSTSRQPDLDGRQTKRASLLRGQNVHQMIHTPIQMCVLGSGSGGNCTVVRSGSQAILIDAGFGPNTTRRRLGAVRMQLQDVNAVVLTHLDRDHFRPTWLPVMCKTKISLYVHRGHVQDLERLADITPLRRAKCLHVFDETPFQLPIAEGHMTALRLAHDKKGTFGFRLHTQSASIGYATDLGHVPKSLIDCFAGVNMLAIESNYDPKMQQVSSRPLFLKRRIMGMAGHLSNQDAFSAVVRILDRGPLGALQHLVLLHRSCQCNHERIIHHVFGQDPRLTNRITLSNQQRPTPWLNVRPVKPLLDP